MESLRPGRRTVLRGGLSALAAPAIAAPGLARAGVRDDLDALVLDRMARAGIPGLAVAAVSDGRVRLARGYGVADIATRRPVTAHTMFHIASITKLVTATAVMQLVQEGRADLDAPVAPHLDFPLANPRYPGTPITLRQLLSHTSSLSDARYYEVDVRVPGRDATQPLDAFLRDFLAPDGRFYSAEKGFSDAAPGAAWDYSNVGYALLGHVASRIAGEDLRDRVRRTIFVPLGLRHTSWTLAGAPAALRANPYELVDGVPVAVAPVGSPDWPGSMIRSSAPDLAAFVAAAANSGPPLLTRSLQALMLDMNHPPGLPEWLTGQGLGWQAARLDGVSRPNHWGGDPGVFTAAYLDPASRRGAVVLTNTSASEPAKSAVRAIAARLLAF